MHSRMRHRVAEFLKVLNRAKPEQAEKERKTARYVRNLLSKLDFLKLTYIFHLSHNSVDAHSDGLDVADSIYDMRKYIDVFIIY